MAKTAKGKTQPGTSSVEADEPGETPGAQSTEEEIAIRAYHIYIERGGVEGDPLDDWLQAEGELARDGG
ncbi:MAG: DUF2934 domain-containing protein [Acidobacteriota bacterium]